MGASGSTAASCSSLDFGGSAGAKVDRHYKSYNLIQQQQSRPQSRYLKNGANNKEKRTQAAMRQASSYYDLTGSSPINYLDESSVIEFDRSSGAEVYSLSNANFNVSRPIMVLSPQLITKPMAHSTNLHIYSNNNNDHHHNHQHQHHKPQQQQANHILCHKPQANSKQLINKPCFAAKMNSQNAYKLRRFSDSLHSLDEIMVVQRQSQQLVGGGNRLSSSRMLSDESGSNNYYNNNESKSYAKLTNIGNNHRDSSNNHHYNNHRHHHHHQRAAHNNNNNNNRLSGYTSNVNRPLADSGEPSEGRRPSQMGQMMKRAVSLSSLHDSNVAAAKVNQCRASRQFYPISPAAAIITQNPSDNYNSIQACDLEGLPPNRAGVCVASSPNQHTKLKQASSAQSNNPLAKKILKFKQVASGSKSKQRYMKQSQQQQQQQQGCPVLPPLPRSQSLHELIQLRATENGQRMRTTGTLRGPFGGGDPTTKVNLVAELLEKRRLEQEKERADGDTILSTTESSSVDDGISCDQSSTGGGIDLGKQTASQQQQQQQQQQQEPAQLGKQRLFKKNSPQHQHQNKRHNERHRKSSFDIRADLLIDNQQQQSNQQVKKSEDIRGEARVRESRAVNVKSTLRRTVSHSELYHNHHQELEQQIDRDCDESDDLNELAKFLYQFKQRSANKSRSKEETNETRSQNMMDVKSSSPATTTTTTTSSPQAKISQRSGDRKETVATNHQSPSSTTSTSSGFASSSFSHNSSCSSEEDTRRKSPKKYPAPPRPDEHQPLVRSPAKGNLICGQLKLSSSLLSIVDEYNNQTSSLEPNLSLTSCLLTTNSSAGSSRANEREATKQTTTTSPSSCERHQQQLEQLKRITRLRQMSQSELALNQLATLEPIGGGVSQRQQQQQQSDERGAKKGCKPNKRNKLFNLIRRISDKGSSSMAEVGREQQETGKGHQRRLLQATNSAAGPREPSSSSSIINHGDARGAGCKCCPKSKRSNDDDDDDDECCSLGEQAGRLLLSQANRYSNLSRSMANLGASESICDLNFDCDLELIKKFKATATASEKKSSSNHKESNKQQASKANRKPSAQQQAAKEIQVNVSSNSNNNKNKNRANWRLVGGGQQKQQPQIAEVEQQPKQLKQSAAQLKQKPSSSDKKLSGKLYAQAGGWLMRRKNSNQQQQQQKDSGSYSSSSAVVDGNKKRGSFGLLNGEASQLLDEFELTLELEKRKEQRTRRTPTSGCNETQTGDKVMASLLRHQRDHGTAIEGCSSDSNCGSDSDDPDDEFDANYASLSRAMISATLGDGFISPLATASDTAKDKEEPKMVELIHQRPLDSPSDSFTFSRPSSPGQVVHCPLSTVPAERASDNGLYCCAGQSGSSEHKQTASDKTKKEEALKNGGGGAAAAEGNGCSGCGCCRFRPPKASAAVVVQGRLDKIGRCNDKQPDNLHHEASRCDCCSRSRSHCHQIESLGLHQSSGDCCPRHCPDDKSPTVAACCCQTNGASHPTQIDEENGWPGKKNSKLITHQENEQCHCKQHKKKKKKNNKYETETLVVVDHPSAELAALAASVSSEPQQSLWNRNSINKDSNRTTALEGTNGVCCLIKKQMEIGSTSLAKTTTPPPPPAIEQQQHQVANCFQSNHSSSKARFSDEAKLSSSNGRHQLNHKLGQLVAETESDAPPPKAKLVSDPGKLVQKNHSPLVLGSRPLPPPAANLICRSNSELDNSPLRLRQMNNGPGKLVAQQQTSQLFGKLRNSLLSRRQIDQQHPVSTSGQLSLVNYYALSGASRLALLSPPNLKPKPSNRPIDSFDENFILKRKTPNAGLKTRC